MDTRTGEIFTPEQMKLLGKSMESPFMKPMVISPTPQQMARKPPIVAPYDPCPCGSGKKFKFCCRQRPGPVGLGALK